MDTPLHNRLDRASLVHRLDRDERERTTLSLYRYAKVDNPDFLRDHLFATWQPLGVLGRIYVSGGINAQLSVPTERFDDFRNSLEAITGSRASDSTSPSKATTRVSSSSSSRSGTRSSPTDWTMTDST